MPEITPGRRVDSIEAVLDGEPGDYYHDPEKNSVWFQLPNGNTGRLAVPPWDSITEEADGTITVGGSIQQHFHAPAGNWPGQLAWHGFLEHGQWREC